MALRLKHQLSLNLLMVFLVIEKKLRRVLKPVILCKIKFYLHVVRRRTILVKYIIASKQPIFRFIYIFNDLRVQLSVIGPDSLQTVAREIINA